MKTEPFKLFNSNSTDEDDLLEENSYSPAAGNTGVKTRESFGIDPMSSEYRARTTDTDTFLKQQLSSHVKPQGGFRSFTIISVMCLIMFITKMK